MARAIKQKDLGVIQADIEAGDLILAGASDEKPNLYCMAAYHYGQAAEKCLKAIIKIERPDIYKATDRKTGRPIVGTSHDTNMLMNKAEVSRSGTTAAHTFIAENASLIAEFNNLRYGKQSITRTECEALRDAVKEFEQELERDFIKANPDKEANAKQAQQEWNSRDKTDLALPEAPKTHKTEIEKQIEEQERQRKAQQNRSGGKKNGKGSKNKKPYYKQNGGSYSKGHGKPRKQQGRED